ncbi:MAG: CAP domain-containing protein [Myxococcaceae bacterium]|nr:CAP domain-containing protein [Myxococcaceae bacterium]
MSRRPTLKSAICPALTFAFALCLVGCGEETPDPNVHQEIDAISGATGGEPDHLVPVCCDYGLEERRLADELFALLNAYRAENGLEALERDDGLDRAMQGHCHHMAIHPFFDHIAPEEDIASPWTRAQLCGASANGENIAAGQSSAAAVMESWKSSPGHNANMLDAGFRRVGVGAFVSPEGAPYPLYWGQLFGR